MMIYTVGHSTRAIEDFLALLARDDVRHVADVRAFPGSRRYPQFGRAALEATLAAHHLGYSHHPGLGGRRQPVADSPNTGWRNAGFRGFADYMTTPEFAAALGELRTIADATRTAVMCAEAVPWRCHRSLIADALIALGDTVLDILDTRTQPHRLTPFAVIRNGAVTYPDPGGSA